jgi:hypothetical protein
MIRRRRLSRDLTTMTMTYGFTVVRDGESVWTVVRRKSTNIVHVAQRPSRAQQSGA